MDCAERRVVLVWSLYCFIGKKCRGDQSPGIFTVSMNTWENHVKLCSPKFVKARSTLAEHYGLKPTEIQRLIRLTHLCPELLELVDDAKLPVYVAVPITYLPTDTQQVLYKRIIQGNCKVDIEKAELLKAKYKSGELTEEAVDGILSGQLIPPKTPKRTAVKIKPVVLKKYFKKGESSKEIEETIAAALEFYFSNQKE